MEPDRRIEGTGVPLRRSDVDTDQIIPAVWLKRIERTGFGAGLFSAWTEDPSFVLNQPQYRSGSILIAGPNFGCGSSREHAVWALQESGFYAVISSRFADIFRSNAMSNGMVTVVLPDQTVQRIMEAVETDPLTEIVVDVEQRTVGVPSLGIEESFPMDDFSRHRLMNGLDDISLTLKHSGAIHTYEQRRPSYKPAVT